MKSLFPVKVKEVEVQRRGKRLLGPVDLTLESNGLTIVIGPNGAGKTTLLRMLHGLERVRRGSLHWACDEETARREQAFVFQTPVLLRRTVLQNIAYPLTIRGVPRAEALAHARDWATRVGLGEVAGVQAPRISGGEKQKLALARALIVSPAVLFLDEPCSSLDGAATKDIEAVLRDARSAGTRIIMSTHDLGQAQRLADEVIFMVKGRIREHREAKQFFSAPETAEARAFLRGDIVE
ncbi:ATP-binding cassette domain-containing protein [Marimonas sp. MJW-29]|uniref:ATP-binding cassette domain-containing protein n=1 Tax=Sulfitobacter sediminis TaxID=3234186 RepID=A0ABV3RLG9_9RHOB